MTENDRRAPSPRRPIPTHWKELMDRRGLASVRALANRAGLSQPAVNRVVYSDGKRATDDTLTKIAGALDIPLADVYWLAGLNVPQAQEWTPPGEANRLTARQRAALEDLILAMVDPGERTRTDDQEGAPAADNVHHLRTPGDVHPERDGLDFAADTSHGLSQGQIEWDQGEEPQG